MVSWIAVRVRMALTVVLRAWVTVFTGAGLMAVVGRQRVQETLDRSAVQ